MTPIVGRADDMLIIRGGNFFHTQIEDLLKDIEHASANYQVVVKREGKMDTVEVRIELTSELQKSLNLSEISAETLDNQPILKALHRHITQKIKDNIGLSMDVQLSLNGVIPRSEGGKLSRLVDLRGKK